MRAMLFDNVRVAPFQMNRSTRLPVRGTLVATVVPIFTASIPSSGRGASRPRPRSSRIPWSAASRYCSGFSDRSLWIRISPSGVRATMSVKVPPRSIQNCHFACIVRSLRAEGTL